MRSSLEQLQKSVEELRKQLGDDFANLLLATPHMAHVPGYRLLNMGLAIWPDTEQVRNQHPEKPATQRQVADLLDKLVEHGGHLTVWTGEDVIALNGPSTDVLIEEPKWTPVYLAIAAWYEVHRPTFYAPAPLPEDPAERLDVLCEQIRLLNDGEQFDMALTCTTLRELGVADMLDGYVLTGNGPARAKFNLSVIIAQVANNNTIFITSVDPCSIRYKYLANTYVVEGLPPAMFRICEAFAARRKRLTVHLVNTLA